MEAIIVRRRKSNNQIQETILLGKNLIELVCYGSNLCVGWYSRGTVWAPDVDRVRADSQYITPVLDLVSYVRHIVVYDANEVIGPHDARCALKNIQEPNKIMIRAIQSVTKEYLLSGQCNTPHTSPFIAQRHRTTSGKDKLDARGIAVD